MRKARRSQPEGALRTRPREPRPPRSLASWTEGAHGLGLAPSPEPTTPARRPPLDIVRTRGLTCDRKTVRHMATKSLTIRLDEQALVRLDALAEKLSRPGLEINRTDAVRLVIETGLTVEEEKLKTPQS